MTSQMKSTLIIGLTLVIALGLQIIFMAYDDTDSPHKAAKEFARAFYKADLSMADRLCENRKVVNGVNVVNKYVLQKFYEAKERGFRPFYMKDKLYNLTTETIEMSDTKAKIRVTAHRKPPVKAFFTGEKGHNVDQTIDIIKENGKWKACGLLFELPLY